jgi:hypothetical protein
MSGILNALVHSGPGWLNDIFTLQVFFDSDFQDPTTSPNLVKQLDEDGEEVDVLFHRALFSSGAKVCGFVRITAPATRSVKHNGIVMKLESTFIVEQETECRDLFLEQIDLVPSGSISGTVDFPFAFEGAAREGLRESFEGQHFSIRHNVTATILRPWYTFEVTSALPITIQRIYDIQLPASSPDTVDPVLTESRRAQSGSIAVAMDANASEASSEGKEAIKSADVEADIGSGKDGSSRSIGPLSPSVNAQLALYGPQQMEIDSMQSDARIVVSYDKGCYELSDHLSGSIDFANIQVPIVFITVAVVKVERLKEEVTDHIVFDEAILDARHWKARKSHRKLMDANRARAAATGAVATAETTASGDEATAPVSEGGVEDERNEWYPSDSDYAASGEEGQTDPDLPVLGDVSLALDLDFSQLENLTPTFVIDLAEIDEDRGTVTNNPRSLRALHQHPAAASRSINPDDEASVRYYLRVTTYTEFDAEARRWQAQEIVLYRDQLYGQFVPADQRVEASFLKAPLKRKGSDSKSTTSTSASPRTEDKASSTSTKQSVKPIIADPVLARKTSNASAGSGITPRLPPGAASPLPHSMGRSASFGIEDEMVDAETGLSATVELASVPIRHKSSASSVGSGSSARPAVGATV